MSVVRAAVVIFAIGLTPCAAAVSWAEGAPSIKEMVARSTNETGFTLEDLLRLNIGELVRHPLTANTLSRVSGDVHKAPRRGVQFELLTPGDIGATVHLRW